MPMNYLNLLPWFVVKQDQNLPPAQACGVRIYVIFLEFADVDQLVNVFFGQQAAKPPTTGAGTGVNPNTASLFERRFKIYPEKATNSLIVKASHTDYLTVKKFIGPLDIPRDPPKYS